MSAIHRSSSFRTLSLIADIGKSKRRRALSAGRLSMLTNTRFAGVPHEAAFNFTAFDYILPFLSHVASLVLHHHAGGFHWATLRVSSCLQLPRNLCCQFGSFPSCRPERCSFPKFLFTLASPKRKSSS